MSASEIVAKLTQLIEEHGDQVVVDNYNDNSIKSISYSYDENSDTPLAFVVDY